MTFTLCSCWECLIQANTKYEEMRQKATEAVPDKIKDMVRNHDNEMHAEVNLIQLEPVTQQFCSLYTGAALHAAALIETLLARLCSTYQLCLQKICYLCMELYCMGFTSLHLCAISAENS